MALDFTGGSMLILSRQLQEGFTIRTPQGTNIRVVVVDIRGDKVRLGIEAPKDHPIHRDEVWEALNRHGKESANVLP